MRHLVVSTLVSLDGVIGSPNRWANFDEEDAQYAMEQSGSLGAFVMGRVTYEFFRANWSGVTGDAYVEKIGAMPKHVASRSLEREIDGADLRPAEAREARAGFGGTVESVLQVALDGATSCVAAQPAATPS
jgi:dihydrofolate reductase